jgi:hypothetical protein
MFRGLATATRRYSGTCLAAAEDLVEGVLVAIGLAVACLWIADRAFVRENA